jgi:hypothetical protein
VDRRPDQGQRFVRRSAEAAQDLLTGVFKIF